MKLCASPANTTCMYQRIARDQAPTEPVDTDAVQRAYSDLYQCLESNNDSEALSLLKHLMNAMTGDGAMDEPMPFTGRPTPAMDSARRVAANVRAGKTQAQQYLFSQRFPGASRIRVVG
jgi:hypothetical protein